MSSEPSANQHECPVSLTIFRTTRPQCHPELSSQKPLSIETLAAAVSSPYARDREVAMRADHVEVLRSTLEDLLRQVECYALDNEPIPPYYLDDLKFIAQLLQAYGYTGSTIRSSDGSLLVVLHQNAAHAA